jgi:hypothetical protein
MYKTAEQIIQENMAFMEEHNLNSWTEVHAKVLELRLANKQGK